MPQALSDSDKIKREMRQNWDDASAGWKKWWQTFERAAQTVSDRLVELAGVQSGSRVLDIATGIGEPSITAARKVGPSGFVLATDVSPGMLAAARERANALGLHNIEFREADAETLAFAEHDFDAVLCRFGLMFVPNLVGALRRIKELLVDGGRLATAVWSKSELVPMISLSSETVRKLANLPPPPADAPNPLRLNDQAALERSFREAGLRDFHSEPITVTYEFETPEQFALYRYEVSMPFRRTMAGLTPEMRDRVMKAIAEDARRFVVNGAVKLPNQAFCIAARK